MVKIIFICTSNTCRSPVAEEFAVEWIKQELDLTREEQEAKGVEITSAGITDAFEKPGAPASANAVQVMSEYGIDLSHHRSRMLTSNMIKEADYLVCVSCGHVDKVLEMFPEVRERPGLIMTLSRDVPDPWHMSYETYMENVAQLEELVREFMEKSFTL